MEKEFYKHVYKCVYRKNNKCLISCYYSHEDRWDNIIYCTLFHKDLKQLEKNNKNPFESAPVLCCQECNKYFGVKDVNS